MSNLVKLDAGYQNYAWGKPAKNSFVAKMKGLSNDPAEKRYAELWVGTHPSCPSRLCDGDKELLSDFLKKPDNAKKFYSPEQEALPDLRDQVPYLLKILSISTALSIQAHPNKTLAKKLHAANPDKYKDANHKPELICALTPFQALCCFRSLREIVTFIKASPELAGLVSARKVLGPLDRFKAPVGDSNEEKAMLKELLTALYAVDEPTCTAALRSHLARVKASPACKEDKVFTTVYDQYPDDVGCWMIYILNYVEMVPGEALFLSEDEPHAYISGDGVEIMASSDNVVRAGLTPKWKDVPTLISMLKYNTSGLAQARHARKTGETPSGWQTQYYQPPTTFPDFSLFRYEYEHTQGDGRVVTELPTIGLGFCLEGEALVNGTKVVAGECFAVPYGKVEVKAQAKKALVFIATTNQLRKKSKF